MTDLDTLRPEVREAIAYCDGIFDDADNGEWAIIRAELLRLADENARLLAANRDCVAHFETMQDDLAALKARIAESCRADGQRVFDLLCLPIEYGGKLALVPVDD